MRTAQSIPESTHLTRRHFFVFRALQFGEHPGVEEMYKKEEEMKSTDILLVITTFFVSIILLNILIAVLNLSYNEGYQNAYRTFVRRRAHVITQHLARQRLYKWFLLTFRKG